MDRLVPLGTFSFVTLRTILVHYERFFLEYFFDLVISLTCFEQQYIIENPDSIHWLSVRNKVFIV